MRYIMIFLMLLELGIQGLNRTSSHQLFPPAIQAVAWSPDGTKIAAGIGGGEIRIYDTELNEITRLQTDGSHQFGFNPAMAWSPDSSKLAFFYNFRDQETYYFRTFAGIWNIDASNNKLTSSLEVANPGSLAWNSTSNYVAVAALPVTRSADGLQEITDISVSIIEVSTGNISQTIREVPFVNVQSIVWSPDNQQLAVAGIDDKIIFYSTATGELLKTISTPEKSFSLVWSPDGTQIAYVSSTGIVIRDIHSSQIVRTYEKFGSISAYDLKGDILAFSDAVSEQDLFIRIFRVSTGEQLNIIEVSRSPYSLSLSPDGNRLVYGSSEETIGIFEITYYAPTPISTIPVIPSSAVPLSTLTPTFTPSPSPDDLLLKVNECVIDRQFRYVLQMQIQNEEWQAFIHELRAQADHKIPAECVAELIAMLGTRD